MTSGMATEKCTGLMVQFIKGSGLRGYSRARESSPSQMAKLEKAGLKTTCTKDLK